MNQMVGADQLIGATVFDRIEARIGEVGQVYVDAATERPEWVGVRVERSDAEVLVPLEGADWSESAVHASVTRASAHSAPPLGGDQPPTPEQEDRLMRHYGIPHACVQRSDVDLQDLGADRASYSVCTEVR